MTWVTLFEVALVVAVVVTVLYLLFRRTPIQRSRARMVADLAQAKAHQEFMSEWIVHRQRIEKVYEDTRRMLDAEADRLMRIDLTLPLNVITVKSPKKSIHPPPWVLDTCHCERCTPYNGLLREGVQR